MCFVPGKLDWKNGNWGHLKFGVYTQKCQYSILKVNIHLLLPSNACDWLSNVTRCRDTLYMSGTYVELTIHFI